ncbi:hypothetical protein AMTRI_Chr02g261250 [Amborella trichopoda]|uniref:Nematode resistance protein-like HSPRO1 N-terminal domain-containing protein n=1 Tax=Amborella trichopoda TaxID=13333 RepID=W1P930_AMBTC|nr:hypothetical protein AMTR_s00003p00269910 [Amborella trichopoda]
MVEIWGKETCRKERYPLENGPSKSDEEEREKIASCYAPTVNLHLSKGVVTKGDSLQEMWKINGASFTPSQQSLLPRLGGMPRLGAWHKSQDIALKPWFSIECHFQRAPFTQELQAPNLFGKPVLEYDLVCKLQSSTL